jgi:N-acetylneuraminic acid mutarotase
MLGGFAALGPGVTGLATANTWTAVAPMPGGGRASLASAVGPDGRIYAIGGYDSGFNILDRVEAYDTSTNTWTTVAPMPGGGRRVLAAATGPDGRIYAIGGIDSSKILNRVEAYDTTTNTWTTVAPMPGGARAFLAAATGPDGRIYAIGGSDGTADLARVEAYDTRSNTWTTLAPMPGGGRGLLVAATGPDGRIYAIGGSNGPGGSGPLDTVEAYNVSSNTWTTALGMAAGARNFLAGATGPDGRVYAIGGVDSGSNVLDRVEAYVTIGGSLSATGTSITAIEGGAFSGLKLAGFRDADQNLTASMYSATISWGDTTSSSGLVTSDGSGGYTVTGSHTYVEKGTFSITVQISDLDGGTTSVSTSAAVADAALSATGLHLKQNNDSVSGVVANFMDADPGGLTGDYTASIHWGDGTVSTGTVAASGSGFTVSASHHYSKDKEKASITIIINDVGGSTATATTIAKE